MVVDNHSAGWLKRGFPWVYPKEVVRKPRRLEPGSAVRLEDARGVSLGSGIWDDGWLAVRRFRADVGPLDRAWIERVLTSAAARRQGLLPPETDAWRLVHAENDDLPGVRVDVWGPDVHVTLDSPALRPLLPPLQRAIEELHHPSRLTLGWRADPRDRQRTRLPVELLAHREDPANDPKTHSAVVRERGVSFEVFPAGGSDAGLFRDMRDNRAWLDPAWKGRRVLNLFAYTGAFSVFAALRGARRVVTADLAVTALDRAKRNFTLNGLDPGEWEFDRGDAFQQLDRYRRKGLRFDLVLADPPPFSQGKHGTFSVAKDLTRLVAACVRVLEPAGLLVLACNQGTVAPRAFRGAVEQAAKRAGCRLHAVHSGTQPPDFPSAVHFPEGRYLKLGVWARGASP